MREESEGLSYSMELQVVREGYDRKTEWFQPRVAVLPNGRLLLTAVKTALWGSDIFEGMWQSISWDFGRSWSEFRHIKVFNVRMLPDGCKEAATVETGKLHKPTEKVLYFGSTTWYYPGERGKVGRDTTHPRDVVYAYYDPAEDSWAEWRRLEIPDKDRHYWSMACCCDGLFLENGDILQPVYAMDRDSVGENFWRGCFRTKVLRLRFDGEEVEYLEEGNELSVKDPRGLYEASLTKFRGEYYLTLRNDLRGYVARSSDGLHFEKPVPWCFDDGSELGSYNTQQHWVTHSDGLFLVYTRRGADNDYVIRHRAPLFMAEVNPEKLCVLGDTEVVLVPNKGAQLGNFGTVNVSPYETWVLTSEGMHGDAKNPMDVRLTESRGANNRIYIVRIKWDRPNKIVENYVT